MNDTNHFKPISEILKERKAKLLGHILRGCNRENDNEDFGENHLLFNIIFKDDGRRNITDKLRVGRPRQSWTKEAMKDIEKKLASMTTLRPR